MKIQPAQKITPFLWFDHQAEEAAHFYTSIFRNSKIHTVTRYTPGGRAPAGSVMTVTFELEGQLFTALNAGPVFQFTEAVSFVVNCDSQAEIDYFWEKLIAGGGAASQCGWLKDKFGLSWQVVPAVLPEWLADGARAERVMRVVLTMTKLDLARLEAA